jgi:hypothetical protein
MRRASLSAAARRSSRATCSSGPLARETSSAISVASKPSGAPPTSTMPAERSEGRAVAMRRELARGTAGRKMPQPLCPAPCPDRPRGIPPPQRPGREEASMFTGHHHRHGHRHRLEQRGDLRARIACGLPSGTSRSGASVACDGVCLTVVERGTEDGRELVRRRRLGRDRVEDQHPLGRTGRRAAASTSSAR